MAAYEAVHVSVAHVSPTSDTVKFAGAVGEIIFFLIAFAEYTPVYSDSSKTAIKTEQNEFMYFDFFIIQSRFRFFLVFKYI